MRSLNFLKWSCRIHVFPIFFHYGYFFQEKSKLESSIDELEDCLAQEKSMRLEAVKFQRKTDSELRSTHESFSQIENSLRESEKISAHREKELRALKDQMQEVKREESSSKRQLMEASVNLSIYSLKPKVS